MKTTFAFLTIWLAALSAHAGLEISSVSLSPTAATYGQSITGTVRLSEGCKYSAGCVVSLRSNNTSIASVPASVTVASGATSKSFVFNAGSASGSASITGTFDGKSASTSLSVSSGSTAPAPLCTANSTRSCSISNGTGSQTCLSSGSAWSTCLAVSCNSGYTLQNGACVASAPAQVCEGNSSRTCTVPNGSGSQQCNSSGTAWYECVAFSCNSGYTLQNGTCVASTTQQSNSGTPNVFQMSGGGNAGVLGASSGSNVEIYANLVGGCKSASGCVIKLTSSNPAVLPVPSGLAFGNGVLGTTIYVPAGTVTEPTTVSVTASSGGISKTLSTTIFPGAVPPAVMHMYMYGDGGYNPVSGQTVIMQLNMYSACPVNGCTVSMSSSNAAIPVPATVFVPAGQDFVQFPVKTGTVSTKTAVTITASYYGKSWNSGSSLTLRPPWPRNADGSINMVAITQYPGKTQLVSNTNQQNRAWDQALWSMMYDDVDINLYNQCQQAMGGNGQLIGTSQPTKMARVSDGYSYSYSYTQNYVCRSGYQAWLQSVTSPAGTVTAPQGFTVTACLERPAPSNVTVSFSSNTSAARVPSSATIAAGQQCVTVNVTTSSLSDGYAGIDATITAKLNGLWKFTRKTVYY